MKNLTDQEILSAISTFEKIKDINPAACDFIKSYREEFLRRREKEHHGMSKISIMNYRQKMLNPFALFDSDFEDIGEQMSITLPRICRFWGQTQEFYSVAQHCLSMVEYFEGNLELQRYAILHEVFEAFSFDCATPIKKMLPAYKSAEDRALESVVRLHKLRWPIPPIIKEVDKGLMVMEAKILMGDRDEYWHQYGSQCGELYRAEAGMKEIKDDFSNTYLCLFGGVS